MYRKKGKKSRRARKVRRGRKTVNVNRSLQPIAQRYICQMKYSQMVKITGFGLNVQRFNLNSIFDPDRTGLGHQPYSHDTLATLYNRYRVISCKYAVSIATTDGIYSTVAVLPANEDFGTSSGTISEVRENPRCKYLTQAPDAPLRTISGKVFIPSLVGRSKSQYMADDRYQAQYGASPSELAVLNVFTSPIDENITSAPDVVLTVTLVYTVESFDVKNLAQS